MSREYINQVSAMGFRPAGAYLDEAFAIEPSWRPREVVYLWAEGAAIHQVFRVGVACGRNGFGSRYDHYNRWLAGRFKPDDAREQKVRSVFRSRLNADVKVWAREVVGKSRALLEEGDLRRQFGEMLDLDLIVRGSWGKRQMAQWRADGRPSVHVM